MLPRFSSYLKKNPKPRKSQASRRPSLGFENLEDRRVFSVNMPTLVGGALVITEASGSVANDVVDVRQTDSSNRLEVLVNGSLVRSFRSSDVNSIKATFGAGNDTFNYRLLSDLTQRAKTVDVILGNGNDAFNFYGNQHDIREDLSLSLNAGAGNDTLWANPGGVDDARFTVFADLGSGDDRLPFFLNCDISDDAIVSIRVLGGSENDVLSFSALNDVDIDDGAQLSVTLEGGEGADSLNAYYRGENDGEISLNVHGGNGHDTAHEEFSFEEGSRNRRRSLAESGIQQWL